MHGEIDRWIERDGNDRSGVGECERSLALAHDVERLISQLESSARGDD